MIEVVDYGNRLLFMANSKRGTRAPQPLKVPRPQSEKAKAERREMSTPADVQRFFKTKKRRRDG